MKIGEAVFEAISGGYQATEVDSLADALEVLEGDHSASSTARAFGIAPSTWRRWKRGAKARADVGWLVDSANRELRRQHLSRAREQRMRQPWSMDTIAVTATYRYASGGTMKDTGEGRELPLGGYLNDVADELLDAYLDGASTDELGEIFTDAINDAGWYAQTFREEGDGAWDIHSFEGWGD